MKQSVKAMIFCTIHEKMKCDAFSTWDFWHLCGIDNDKRVSGDRWWIP